MLATIDNTKFKHYHSRESSTGGGATLGWTYNTDTLFVACSVCSKEDQFVKEVGRTLVLKRLNDEINSIESEFNISVSLDEIKAYLVTNVDESFPTLTFNKAMEIIEDLSFEDLKYELLAKIATDIFIG